MEDKQKEREKEPTALTKLKCCKCGYEWIPRKSNPAMCPNLKCRTAYWREGDRDARGNIK